MEEAMMIHCRASFINYFTLIWGHYPDSSPPSCLMTRGTWHKFHRRKLVEIRSSAACRALSRYVLPAPATLLGNQYTKLIAFPPCMHWFHAASPTIIRADTTLRSFQMNVFRTFSINSTLLSFVTTDTTYYTYAAAHTEISEKRRRDVYRRIYASDDQQFYFFSRYILIKIATGLYIIYYVLKNHRIKIERTCKFSYEEDFSVQYIGIYARLYRESIKKRKNSWNWQNLQKQQQQQQQLRFTFGVINEMYLTISNQLVTVLQLQNERARRFSVIFIAAIIMRMSSSTYV